jgi:GNAT superfamily N-acetyltransferase
MTSATTPDAAAPRSEARRMSHRAAVDADVPMLARFNQQLIEDEWGGGGMSLDRLEERIRRWLADEDYRALLFEEHGETVAYALVSLDEDSAYVRHFYVVEAHRGGGVGRRAVELLLREVVPPTARVTLDVLASNRGGHQFWRSVGFTDYAIRMERTPDVQGAEDRGESRALTAQRATAAGAVAQKGCGAADRGADSPLLGPTFSKRFRWEVLPEPNPDCARVGPSGEADAEHEALGALRAVLAGHQAGFGVLYEIEGEPARARELQRIRIEPPVPKPPVW